jgi:hypothetical protein
MASGVRLLAPIQGNLSGHAKVANIHVTERDHCQQQRGYCHTDHFRVTDKKADVASLVMPISKHVRHMGVIANHALNVVMTA